MVRINGWFHLPINRIFWARRYWNTRWCPKSLWDLPHWKQRDYRQIGILPVWFQDNDHEAQCRVEFIIITTARFPMVFLPCLFTFSSSSRLVFTTWNLKLPSGKRGTCTRGPRSPKGTRGLCRMLWYDRNISKVNFERRTLHFVWLEYLFGDDGLLFRGPP